MIRSPQRDRVSITISITAGGSAPDAILAATDGAAVLSTRAELTMTMTIPRDTHGFRLRGLDMTRIETFTDAAFAFALTMLVISLDPPKTMQALGGMFIHIPGFVLGATLLMAFWNAHHRWSRRYGLDDGTTIVLSCILVFTVLVFVYPLRYMNSALSSFFAGMTGLPIGPDYRTLGFTGVQDVNRMFMIYGIGFMAMSFAIVLLNLHAWRLRDALELNEPERIETRAELGTWCILFAAGLLSTVIAAAFPDATPTAGWAYAPLGIVIPVYVRLVRRKARKQATKGL